MNVELRELLSDCRRFLREDAICNASELLAERIDAALQHFSASGEITFPPVTQEQIDKWLGLVWTIRPDETWTGYKVAKDGHEWQWTIWKGPPQFQGWHCGRCLRFGGNGVNAGPGLPPCEPHRAGDECPTCGCTNPAHHPAVQAGGEVHLCENPWHRPTAAEIRARESHREGTENG